MWAGRATAAVVACLAARAFAVEHVISVGKGNHKFSPDTITANINDTLRFEFYPTNHSVVRSSFDYPCIPYELSTPTGGSGFFSGFHTMTTLSGSMPPPSYTLRINDTAPLFFYCSAPGSCNQWGMVGTVNPTKDTPLADYRTRALQAQYVLQPGETWPSESSPSASAPAKDGPPASGMSTAGVAGLVAGLAAFFALLAAGGWWLYGRGRSSSGDGNGGASSDRWGKNETGKSGAWRRWVCIGKGTNKNKKKGRGSGVSGLNISQPLTDRTGAVPWAMGGGFEPPHPALLRAKQEAELYRAQQQAAAGIPLDWGYAPSSTGMGVGMAMVQRQPVEIYSPSEEERREMRRKERERELGRREFNEIELGDMGSLGEKEEKEYSVWL